MNAKPIVTLYAPADAASHVCVEGEMVAINEGKVEVTGEAINILIAHGFTTEPPKAADPAAEPVVAEVAADPAAEAPAKAGKGK